MYQIKFAVNISSNAKNIFVTKWLIPFLNSNVETEYYFTRSVEIIPVINLYIKTSEVMITYIYSKMQKLFNDFIFSLNSDDRQSNSFYIKNQKDISRINGFQKKDMIDNLNISCKKIDKIERYGEYNNEIDKEIFTEFFFKGQKILEKSIDYLYEKDEDAELVFLYGLFLAVSKQLDNTGVGHGYLSFKSHLLGFLNYKHKDIDKYKILFEKRYVNLKSQIIEIRDILMSEEDEEQLNDVIKILKKWKDLFEEMYGKLLEAENKEANQSLLYKIRLGMRHREFKKLSGFHDKAFSNKNRDFFKLKEFQAYRMLVNFTYQLLPAMGLNSRKRVEASYLLVTLFESE